ncbi:MAG: DUF438 domain-containing protein, partial [Nitrospirae bacterium]|nr:DUF438 domain-containing protein [Nitrospirota bacterium]
MQLSPKTKIDELLKDYPFLMDFFLSRSPKFKLLESSLMRKTVGRMATLTQVASIGGIEPATLLSEIAAEIRAKTGQEVAVSGEAAGTEVGVLREPEARIEVLKDIIKDLHKGVDMPVLKKRFSELISHIDPSEIAKMEQRLMEEGMPETEVKRLCDVHVQVFKESLEQQEVPATPAGHPVNTLMMENRAAEDIILAIEGILETLNESPDKDLFRQHQKELRNLIDSLEEINLHYLRKENQLFPILEKHNISGPSEVMWAIHDDIRQTLKYAREQVTELQVPL